MNAGEMNRVARLAVEMAATAELVQRAALGQVIDTEGLTAGHQITRLTHYSIQRLAREMEDAAVAAWRATGASWGDIGTELRTTRQAAQQRYGTTR